MATTNDTKSITSTSLLTIPAHLWIGTRDGVRTHIIKLLQGQWCPHQGCGRCSICQAITTEQHYAIQWIRPEKQYTRELLNPLFTQLSFTLNTQEQFFFILEDVDFMPPACANSLLKSLEEPPPGYYFFLCAQREHTILPTIRSRCMLHTIAAKKEITSSHLLFDYFINSRFYDPSLFLADLEKSEINEQESIALLDTLLAYWMHNAKKALEENNSKNYQSAKLMVNHITTAFEKLPMPGSSKIFWKDMYLQMKNGEQ